MSASKTVSSRSFPIVGILQLICITLKLAEIGAVAKWSWWWVLSPLWITAAILLLALVVIFLVLVLKEAMKQSRT